MPLEVSVQARWGALADQIIPLSSRYSTASAGLRSFLTRNLMFPGEMADVKVRSEPVEDILIVEDDQRVRRALERALTGEGYTVATAGDGAEALVDLARSATPPKLIILDLLMPVMDGWQFRQRLLQQPEWALVPVIVFSGTGYESGDSRLPNVVSIPKPVRLQTLFAEVARLIAGGRLSLAN